MTLGHLVVHTILLTKIPLRFEVCRFPINPTYLRSSSLYGCFMGPRWDVYDLHNSEVLLCRDTSKMIYEIPERIALSCGKARMNPEKAVLLRKLSGSTMLLPIVVFVFLFVSSVLDQSTTSAVNLRTRLSWLTTRKILSVLPSNLRTRELKAQLCQYCTCIFKPTHCACVCKFCIDNKCLLEKPITLSGVRPPMSVGARPLQLCSTMK